MPSLELELLKLEFELLDVELLELKLLKLGLAELEDELELLSLGLKMSLNCLKVKMAKVLMTVNRRIKR
ncbi:hypothetical protein AGMMS49921_12440 [Endomicrobiia bacterium]|nr:hypothetical protein AGMMS49921_12440 [Endomicrobiia bacterium]